MKHNVSGCLGAIVGVFVALGIIFAFMVPFGIHKTDLGTTLIAILMLAVPFGFAALFNKYAPKEYQDNTYWDGNRRVRYSEEHDDAMRELRISISERESEALEEEQRKLRKIIGERTENEKK